MRKAASSTRCRAITPLPRRCGPIDAAGIAEDRKGWLFRTARGHNGSILSDKPMSRSDAWRMIRRRAVAAGIVFRRIFAVHHARVCAYRSRNWRKSLGRFLLVRPDQTPLGWQQLKQL